MKKTPTGSRADYAKQRRVGNKSFNVLISEEDSNKITKYLERIKKSKKQWLEEQIQNLE